MNHPPAFANDLEALTAGLVLAVTAPTDADAQRALALAELLAARMSVADIEQAKADAEAELAALHADNHI